MRAMRGGLVLLLVLASGQARGQDVPEGFRGEFMRQFEYSARRLVALAEAMPAETYAWRPMEGVSSVEEVYMHVARYNYYYPATSLGVAAPEGIDVDALESISGKERVVAEMRRSFDHVRALVRDLPEERLSASARLYGRDVPGWSVLLQLLAHMNEHVGQSIAYARTNHVVPPWSRGQ